jgi:DNA replication protein DnaC
VTLKKSSGNNIEQAINLVVPKECWLHKKPAPCPDCEREHAEFIARIKQDEEDVERQTGEELKALLNEKKNNPEKFLQEIGVYRRHLACSFDTYKGGEKIKEVCREFIDDPLNLVLSGGVGSGKTHLAVAILRELIREGEAGQKKLGYVKKNVWHYVGNTALFASAPEILAEIRATYGSKEENEQEIIAKYANVGYLVLDDLGAEKSTEWSISTLYLIIDRRYRNEYPTIVTTNLTMDEIGQHISRRIASRLASGKVVTIKAPDYRMKRGNP